MKEHTSRAASAIASRAGERRLLVVSIALAFALAPGGTVAAEDESTAPDASTSFDEREAATQPAKCFGREATIVALPGIETLGTADADVIVGTDGADVIRGMGGNDRICAGDGPDDISGGGGRDRISGGADSDRLDGGADDDILLGGNGADDMLGRGGRDTLTGGGGGDSLDGGGGRDRCRGGAGVDWPSNCDEPATRGSLIITRNTRLKAPHRGPVIIRTDNVTLDCAGHTVAGRREGVGILLDHRTGVRVKNCGVTNFRDGIQLKSAHRNTLTGNRASKNRARGIVLGQSNRNQLTSNIADDNGLGSDQETFGFWVLGHHNVLTQNSASRNGESNFTTIARSSRNTFKDNASSGGGFGFNVAGDRNTFESNTVTGAGWAFLADGSDNSLFVDNTTVGSSQIITLGGAGNTITGNASDGGYEDGSPPGANVYSDNTCGNDHEGNPVPLGTGRCVVRVPD